MAAGLNCDLWDWGNGHESGPEDARRLRVSGVKRELGEGHEWNGGMGSGVGCLQMEAASFGQAVCAGGGVGGVAIDGGAWVWEDAGGG